MEGQLERVGDGWRLRFSRYLAHPPERVWRAITEPEQRTAWFPDRVVGEMAAGSSLRFESEHVDGGFFEGTVLVADPPRTLEFTWGTDVLRFELEPDGTGCRLTLLDSIDQLGKAARDGAGWHVCLDKLAYRLDGGAPGWTDGDRWTELHGGYVEAFGPQAATLGPPDQ